MTRFTKIAAGVAVASALVVGVALPSMAQRRGPRAQSAPAPAVTCPMYGLGGWWTAAKPTDPEAANLVQTLTELHNTLRTQRQELAGLLATNADQSAVAAKQAEIAKTVAAIQATNARALQIRDKLGLPAGVGLGMGFGRGMGLGLGAGMGWGGWWTRVTPQTDAEKAFVQRITELHNQVRSMQQNLRTMIASNADPKAIAEQQGKIAAVCSQIQKLMADNAALVQRLAGTATAGPGWGMGRGRGMGYGRGMGFGRGMGMNPYCPFAPVATQ